jgi:hypothetical protein
MLEMLSSLALSLSGIEWDEPSRNVELTEVCWSRHRAEAGTNS